jgi:hypothetical protein
MRGKRIQRVIHCGQADATGRPHGVFDIHGPDLSVVTSAVGKIVDPSAGERLPPDTITSLILERAEHHSVAFDGIQTAPSIVAVLSN